MKCKICGNSPETSYTVISSSYEYIFLPRNKRPIVLLEENAICKDCKSEGTFYRKVE